MTRLREVLAIDGFKNIRTYIQSGNAVIDTDRSSSEIEQRVRDLIKKHIGPDLVVVVRTPGQLQNILKENPFQKEFDISRVFFVLFATPPSPEKIKELIAQDFSSEKLVITKNAGYMYIPGTYGSGKLSSNYLEKKLKVSATMRNFNTTSKLIAMGSDSTIAK